MKLALVKPIALTSTDQMIQDFYKQHESQEREERMLLQMVRDSADVWRTCLDKPFATDREVMEEFKDLVVNAVHYYWGTSAWCEFDESKKKIKCCHPDGRVVFL